MKDQFTSKTFPLTVNQNWLDEVEDARHKSESKHDFILKAVQKEIQNRKEENK